MHSQVFPADAVAAGGLCSSFDGTAIVTLHRSGSIVAWSECSGAMLYDDTCRFRPLCSNDCRSTTAVSFISSTVLALGCTDASIMLWYVADEKRGLSWKAHSSGVSMFLATQGPPDGLASSALFSFSRSGVGQVKCKTNLSSTVAILPHYFVSFGTSVTVPFFLPGKLRMHLSSLLVFCPRVVSWLSVLMPSSSERDWFLHGRSSHTAIRVFRITNEAVEREPILQQPIQRFPALTCGAMHAPSGIIAAANEGSVFAFTLSLPAKSQLPVMFAKRASVCVDLRFTSVSGRLAVAHQDGFIYVYKVLQLLFCVTLVERALQTLYQVDSGSNSLHPRVCCVCAHDAPLVALCAVPQTDDLAAADETGSYAS